MSNDSKYIDYEKLTVAKTFQNSIYEVPDYQREYVWKADEQVEQFFNDVKEAYDDDSEKPYFMGTTVVYRNPKNMELNELIDGQQRITTFFILICAIANLLEDEKQLDTSNAYKSILYKNVISTDDGLPRKRFSLQLQYENTSNCLVNIYESNIPNDSELENCKESEVRLYQSYRYLKKELQSSFIDVEEICRFAAFILHKLHYVQIIATNISDALKIFETINQRGAGLDSMDLLKNILFMQVDRENFKKLNNLWKGIMDKLIDNAKEKPLRFLRYFLTANYDVLNEDKGITGILPDKKIYEWFVENDYQCNYSKNPFGFIDKLSKGVDDYISYIYPQDKPGDMYLKNIPRIAGKTMRSPYVLLLAAGNMDENAKNHFKQILESIVYYSNINNHKANETEKIYAAWCPKIRQISNDDQLVDFVNSVVKPQIDKWKNGYYDNFMELNSLRVQKYKIRFIISRISKAIDDERSGRKGYTDISDYYDDKSKYEIEHIMPQNAEDYSTYNVEESEKEEYIYALGNQALLEKVINNVCKAKEYNEKCLDYKSSSIYLVESMVEKTLIGKNTSANRINDILMSWERWNKDTILERQKMLYDIGEQIWDIDNIISTWN